MKFWIVVEKGGQPEIADFTEGFYVAVGEYATIYHYSHPYYIDDDPRAFTQRFNKGRYARWQASQRKMP